MSISQNFSDRKRARKAPEKSNFVHTCNLLSQFIKEKGSLRDLNFEIGDKVESLESIVKADKSQAAAASTSIEKSVQASEQVICIDPVPRRGVPDSSISLQDASNEHRTDFLVDSKFSKKKRPNFHELSRDAATVESKSAQLTIFYAGRVLVFDDYPPEKVTQLVEFASKESCNKSEGILSNHVKEKPNSGGAVASGTAQERLPPRPEATASRKAKRVLPDSGKETMALPPRPEASGSHKAKGILLNSGTEKTSCSRPKEQFPPQLEANGSDLPIARRSSLHRFLEKRKDRSVREQNQIQELQPAYSSKPDDQLELKL
ncbi:Protein TIFY 11B [Forsythia ovata]|uniref:Protein TIFY n=1 Tax=Forsythia ovata TaxID=205694 RepID=A0ABD1TUT1_9LAMI